MQYSTTEGAQGICPTGWHIPSGADWDVLETYAGGSTVAGGKLKEAGFSHWYNYSPGIGTDDYSFTGLPGGFRSGDLGTIYNSPYAGIFWTSTQYDVLNAWRRRMNYTDKKLYKESSSKNDGFSVRCLKE